MTTSPRSDLPRPDAERSADIRAMIVDTAARAQKRRPTRRAIVIVSFVAAAVLAVGGTAAAFSFGAGGRDIAVPAGPGFATLSPGPSPSPSEPGHIGGAGTTATPVTPGIADVDTVVLHAAELDLLSGSTPVEKVEMTSTKNAVATLTTLLGAPVVTETKAYACVPRSTSYEWGGTLRLTDGENPVNGRTPDFFTSISGTMVPAADGKAITLEAAGGVKVGQNVSAAIAETADDEKHSYTKDDGVTSSVYQIETGWNEPASTDGSVQGLAGLAENGIATGFSTPVSAGGEGDC